LLRSRERRKRKNQQRLENSTRLGIQSMGENLSQKTNKPRLTSRNPSPRPQSTDQNLSQRTKKTRLAGRNPSPRP
jgi:hypothetical protein